MQKTISRSNKMRSGVYFSLENGKIIKKHDGYQRHWKQVVEIIPTGKKNKKGKEIHISNTYHLPI